MNEQQLIQHLKSRNVCDQKIYPVNSPDNVQKPYCIYSVIRGSLCKDLQGSHGNKSRYMFTAWTNTYSQAISLVNDFHNAMNSIAAKAGEPIIDNDPDTGAFRITNNDWYVIS